MSIMRSDPESIVMVVLVINSLRNQTEHERCYGINSISFLEN